LPPHSRRRGGEPGHGFLLDRGTFTTIDIPDESGPRPTQIVGINNSGRMVGVFITRAGIFQGFVMDTKAVITATDHPDTTAPGRTRPRGINDRGEIVGVFARD
jgi:hypothetical protein